MVFIKRVDNASAGTADSIGGDDWDKLDSYFDDIDIGVTAKINTATTYSIGPKMDNYVDLKAITVPSSPSSGYMRLFIDTADGKIKIKRSNGDVVIIE